jgi:hypothetical protein
MHCASGYPQYCAEAVQRYHYYTPPYGGGYATPWLWYDGNYQASYSYSSWRAKLVTKMGQASNCTVTKWGYYNPVRDSGYGRLYVKFHNDSTGTMRGRIRFVLTEDSIYYAGPNGDAWHNHVARDYLPDTSGTLATLAPHDSIITYRDFYVKNAWVASRCKIVVWFQKDSLYADSSKRVYQAGVQQVTALPVGIEEGNSTDLAPGIRLAPNPCFNNTILSFQVPLGSEYRIRIFDITGRQVRLLNGVSRSDIESVSWNLRDDQGQKVGSGIYLYRFENQDLNTTGKIVVR